LILATTQHMVSWYLGGRWQDVAVFMILAAFLLLRPQGVLGGSLRKATV
jgi:branched-subunit amino acid ABC-type transport system permease component